MFAVYRGIYYTSCPGLILICSFNIWITEYMYVPQSVCFYHMYSYVRLTHVHEYVEEVGKDVIDYT